MGIAFAQLEHLLHIKQNYPNIFTGAILQLGRQDTYFDLYQMMTYFQTFGIKIEKNHQFETRKNVFYGEIETVSDNFLFKNLGFETVDSMDFVGDEGATIVHDLNNPVDKNLYDKFDLIYDSGTTEHVFDVASVFRNIHNMLKPGGVIVHELPTNNFVDHGFWQISPTLFADAYGTNNYEMLEMLVTKVKRGNLHTGPYERIKYDPEVFAALSIGGHDSEIMGTFCAFRKNIFPLPWAVPIQGFYRKHWSIAAT